jgi:ClpP class serine protease
VETAAAGAGSVAVIAIRGPLFQYRNFALVGSEMLECGDSFESVRDRAAAAFASSAQSVLLWIDSPGGVVAGCFETVCALREMATKSGKTLAAHVEGTCASAAYALACAATTISASPTSLVGSVGVLDCIVDLTANDAANGVRYEMVATGARKTDGNPHTEVTPDAVDAYRLRAGDVVEFFYSVVSYARGLSVEDVAALNADIFVGARAQGLKLVDTIGYLPAQIAALAAQAGPPTPAPASDRDQICKARAAERKALLAARPDLPPKMLAVLSNPKQTPLETVRSVLRVFKEPEGAKPMSPEAVRAHSVVPTAPAPPAPVQYQPRIIH